MEQPGTPVSPHATGKCQNQKSKELSSAAAFLNLRLRTHQSCFDWVETVCQWPVLVKLCVCVAEQEYRNRKAARLRRRIEEHLRSAALPPADSAFGPQSSSSDLSELLQTFRCSGPSDSVMTKGTHFTHTQKFTFTRVSRSSAPVRTQRVCGASVSVSHVYISRCADAFGVSYNHNVVE